MKFVPPSVSSTSYTCPVCGVLAVQHWFSLLAKPLDQNATPDKSLMRDFFTNQHEPIGFRIEPNSASNVVSNLHLSKCYSCNAVSVWNVTEMIYPEGTVLQPHPDTPDKIKPDFEEAASILNRSPRGAAALLRLALEKLCQHLCGNTKKINDNIADLVKGDLPVQVQKMLDTLRVIGNEAVHPGTMDLRDEPETAAKLFQIFNLIVGRMITEPNNIAALYDSMPSTKRDAIDRRDGKDSKPAG